MKLGSNFSNLRSFHLKYASCETEGSRKLKFVSFRKDEVAEEYKSGLEVRFCRQGARQMAVWWRYDGDNACAFLMFLALRIVYY